MEGNSLPRRVFAWLLALMTLGLISLGGLVTSHGAGMAVPDWPNSYGYHMFFFPWSLWRGAIFYEHSHRIAASVVGFMTLVLGVWAFGRRARGFLRRSGGLLTLVGLLLWAVKGDQWRNALVLVLTGGLAFGASWIWPRCEAAPAVWRRWAVVAVFGVVLQGLLGGLRVALYRDAIGIFHAALAQLFFVLVVLLAVSLGPAWRRWVSERAGTAPAVLWRTGALLFVLVGVQLILGATMRHQHAGLAVPDFPLAYGELWPDLGEAAVERYNLERPDADSVKPIQPFHIVLHLIHRGGALVILGGVLTLLALSWKQRSEWSGLAAMSAVLAGLVLAQGALGAATVWTGKAADVATAHVALGALLLALTGRFVLSAWAVRARLTARQDARPRTAQPVPVMAAARTEGGA